MADTPAYFTRDNLIKFLSERQGEYQYDTTKSQCPIALFMEHNGATNPCAYFVGGGVKASATSEYQYDGTFFVVPEMFVDVVSAKPHTYEAALERAQKAD